MTSIRIPHPIVAVATLAVMSFAIPAFAQLSPGDLAAPHAHLEDLSNCTSCHELGKGPSAEKCLECHKNVAARIDAKRGYHHIVVNMQDKACFVCHSDHAGREFELINWPGGVESFHHGIVGFELVGAHATKKCRDCHKPELIKEPLRSLEPKLDLTKTYLGLRTGCLDCHKDQHKGTLGSDCLKCHTNDHWKPATAFDHDQTRYRLTGKHKQAPCAECHLVSGKVDTESAVYKYRDLKFSTCTDCHKDKHEGKFGKDCTKCHRTTGWKDLPQGDFDHDKTDYPLRGKHVKVDCKKCHTTGSLLAAIRHEACTDCHKDIHVGQFASRPDGGRCESCHSVDRFLPAQYTIEDHNRSDFRLEGAHLAQPCIACHAIMPEGELPAYRLFVNSDPRCATCHDDRHQGQFINTEPVKLCNQCHNNSAWRIAEFDHDHTAYPLTGKHRGVACNACHKAPDSRPEAVAYRGLSQKCESCHVDPAALPALNGDNG